MPKCKGTPFTNCEHDLIVRGNTLCNKCLIELQDFRDELMGVDVLRKKFIGGAVDANKLKKENWCDQISSDGVFILPREAGYWSKQLDVGLLPGYLLIKISKSSIIDSVGLHFFHISNTGTATPGETPLNDEERAQIEDNFQRILVA